jgi:TPR repeat protein
MRHRGAAAWAFLVALSAATFAVGANSPTPTPEAAVSGIGQILPPLSDRARKKLTARADAGELNAMYELAHHALMSCAGLSDFMCGAMYYWWYWNNPREAELWWHKAAALGDPKAMILLGHMYAEPWGVPQDIPKAAEWFKKAADMNSLEAIQALVDLYIGAWSDERDDAEANRWLNRAAAMGDRHAMLLLGLRSDGGWGIQEDPAEAAHWYEKVIAGGWNRDFDSDLNTAQNNLGALYEEGRGVVRDVGKAAQLYGEAARGRRTTNESDALFYALFDGGSTTAAYNLAVLCEAGRGVQQDKSAAAWLYRKAAFREMPEAIAALKRQGFKIPATAKQQEDEAAALVAHGHEKRTRATCDP